MLLKTMKISQILICTGAMLFFTSCGGEEVENVDTKIESVTGTQRSTPVINGSSDQNLNSNNSNTNIVDSNEEEVMLNPAHGAPGHDCAIAVGAPLSSAANGSPAMVQPSMNNEVKLNPAHGAPGHDCAIAVGAPLS